jgi:hypothetical protein
MGNAIYCRNGHFNGHAPDPNPSYGRDRYLHNWQVEEVEEQLKRLAFCPTCGIDNINGCLRCETTIESEPGWDSERPAFCSACGQPFPWTETVLATATEYADELDELSSEDKTTLKGTFTDLTVDSPRTELAATRFKRIVGKVAPKAGEVLIKIIGDVLSSAAVKAIKG